MQISTRSADYLIDVLELRSHINLLLNVFTNPAIVKVRTVHVLFFVNCRLYVDVVASMAQTLL